MEGVSQVSEFGKVLIYLIMGVVFVLITFFLGKMVALKRPSPEKNSTYECGEEPKGSSWIQFHSRFYVVALIFLLFDVEMVFIFPWATVFGQEVLIQADPRWGWLSFTEMFLFVGVLLTGLLYVWKKGDLNWIKPEQVPPSVDTKIPLSVYLRINQENYSVKKYKEAPVEAKEEVRAPPPTGFKPASRLKFKNPSA